ncbi:MAG: alpha/beta hydrolase fold domain-containing protein [Propionibacteriales bacterium]|nr:alpha/beta hydrolase fold domain-containing protein [Propionibacteriales bacterium]
MTVHGVPRELMDFQATLRPPAGATALEFLKEFDGYQNADPPSVGATHAGVRLREQDGWVLGADVVVPSGDPPYPTLVYLHGGGWVMGSPWTHRRLTAELAVRGLLVFSVDYRRAPKHRFPGAVDDAAFAMDWVRTHAADFGGDPSELLVGGDSAGANLAAAVLASGGGAGVSAALLCYGIYDYHRALPTLAGLLDGSDAESQPYLHPGEFHALRNDPRLSPENHVSEFPPTFLTVGEHDPLRPESESLAARLAAASVPYELQIAADAPHGYLQMPTHPAHDEALDALAAFVRRTCSPPDAESS